MLTGSKCCNLQTWNHIIHKRTHIHLKSAQMGTHAPQHGTLLWPTHTIDLWPPRPQAWGELTRKGHRIISWDADQWHVNVRDSLRPFLGSSANGGTDDFCCSRALKPSDHWFPPNLSGPCMVGRDQKKRRGGGGSSMSMVTGLIKWSRWA